MITSLGTCRLVIPRSESTIARPGPAAYAASIAACTAARWSSSSASIALSRAPRPSLGLTPAAFSSAAWSANSLGKNARTAWPKMIGSETFIIVAFKWTENRTPRRLASAICSARNRSSTAQRITAASSTSPSSTGRRSLSTVTVPSGATCSIRTEPSRPAVTERSVERKSPSLIVATCEPDCDDQAPIEWGWRRAYDLTEAGARRSELPSRKTGLTALPLTLS